MKNAAWAAVHTRRPGYFHTGSVRARRDDVQEYIGDTYANEGESKMVGWRQAYAEGWRVVKVRIVALEQAVDLSGLEA